MPLPTRKREIPLPSKHAAWLAAAIASAQLPLIPYLPWWISFVGLSVVMLRVLLDRLQRAPLPPLLLLIASITCAFAIRLHFGYFVGREPCVALLFLLIGLKFLEAANSRDSGALLCLAAFLSIAQFFYAQNIVAAPASLPAVIIISAAFMIVQDKSGTVSSRYAAARAARMLLHGVPLAFIFFVLFPRISGPLWGVPTDNLARPGLSETMEPGAIRDLSLSDDVAFRVDFDGEIPPYGERYWRGPVLTNFDGQIWRTAVSRPLTATSLPDDERRLGYTVTLEPNSQRYYLALDSPASLPPRAHTTSALEVVADAPITRQMRYHQSSVLRSHYSALIDERANLALPYARNPRTREWARELRARHASDTEFIQAVLARFRNDNFVYSLQATVVGDNAIDAFLFDSKLGFCEHYAASFVFALRAAGIPARIVTGYQGGDMNEAGGLRYMIVRQSDAHAWAEAWVDGEWSRYDPTAYVAPARIQRGLGAALARGERIPFLARLEPSWLRTARLELDALNYSWNRWVVGFNAERQRSLWTDAGLGDAQLWKFVAILTLATTLAAGSLALMLLLRRPKREPIVAQWEALCRKLARAGLPRRANEGPLAYGERAAQRWPVYARYLRAATRAYCVLRYGVSRHGEEGEEDAWSQFKRALRALPAVGTLKRTSLAALGS